MKKTIYFKKSLLPLSLVLLTAIFPSLSRVSKHTIHYGYQLSFDEDLIEEQASENSSLVFTDSYLKTYYSNLTDNIGKNTDESGSCGYVALGMLLSYYDSYWDDTIIGDAYDSISNAASISSALLASPGINRETFSAADRASANSFWSAIQARKSTYFHSYLIDFADANFGYYDPASNPLYNSSSIPYCALNDQQMYNILNGYLSSETNLTYQIYSYYNNQYNTSSIAFVKEQIDLGRPVLVGTKAITQNSSASDIENAMGHAMIAYDYDTVDGETTLYYNYGWGSGYTHSISSNVIVEAYSLSISSSHVCSNNYYDTATGRYYCVCEIDGNHPDHTHSYLYRHVDYSSSMHYSYCACGAKVRRAHNFIDGICGLCGYER